MASGLRALRALLVLAIVLWPAATMLAAGATQPVAHLAAADGPPCDGCAPAHGPGARCAVPCPAAPMAVLPPGPQPPPPRVAAFAGWPGTTMDGLTLSPEPQPPRAGHALGVAATPV